jgi:large subunit ribosomal protein L18
VQTRRLRRQRHVRNRMAGTTQRPRLAVFRSSKHIYAQMINDETGTTLVAASTMEPDIKAQVKYGGNKAAAVVVGRVVAERAKQAGIDKVCFDRRSYRYHGRVAALAQAAREAGLQF